MDDAIRWDIRREGRAWTGDEFQERRPHLPEKFEVIGGRLLWTDEQVTSMLGMLLEQAGAERAVGLGAPSVWKAAIAARERPTSSPRRCSTPPTSCRSSRTLPTLK